MTHKEKLNTEYGRNTTIKNPPHLDLNNNVVIKDLLSCSHRPMVRQLNKPSLIIFENKGN